MARKAEVRYINFYSAGSSAYKVDAMPIPQKKRSMPMPKQRKRKNNTRYFLHKTSTFPNNYRLRCVLCQGEEKTYPILHCAL